MATETLADSLLDDLDDLSDAEEDQNQENAVAIDEINNSNDSSNHDDVINVDDCSSSASNKKWFIDDAKLQTHLAAIEIPRTLSMGANDNDEQQYQLMTASNKFLITVQNELHRIHQDLIAAYRPKFPELDELLPNPIAYKNSIKVIQNATDLTLFNDQLISEAKLTPNQIITLSVASSTTQGEVLEPSQLQLVNNCIECMEQTQSIQQKLILFVESHMERLAPSVSILIGASLAARMIATAGGMAELCKIPSCNLQVLGQVKATSASRAGMGTSIASATAASNAGGNSRVSKPHEGMLAECDLYHRVPGYLQRKALKVIAAKLALAIRCDYVNLESGRKRSNESGKKFRAEIERKFAKLEEPSTAPVVKALPK
jgi:U4/U6 small nuclear ribonucleoprotein PRP31